MTTKELLCRYYADGRCSFGESCFFSHDANTAIPIPDEVCLFHLRTTCINGSNCLKAHKSVAELLDEAGVTPNTNGWPNLSLTNDDTADTSTYYEDYSNDYAEDYHEPVYPNEYIVYESYDASANIPNYCPADFSAPLAPTTPAASHNIALTALTKQAKPKFTTFSTTLNTSTNDDGASTKQKDQISSAGDTAPKSYASIASSSQPKEDEHEKMLAAREICTFFEKNGYCPSQAKCNNIHGDVCELCGSFALHPYNGTQRDLHRQECVREHEKNMEESFAYQRSKDLTCGICLDVVMDKESRKESRFGILENCLHVYCIECIRTWRNSNFDKKNKRGCPQCRIKSDFVIPSEYFYDDKDEKVKLINEYKGALSKQHCKYFDQGRGKCPFEGACFYKHEYPDGSKATLPMPSERRRAKGSNGPMEEYAQILQSLFMDVDSLRQMLTDGDIDISDYEEFLFVED